MKADEPPSQDDAATGHQQAKLTPTEEQASDTEIHKTRSKGEVASVDADATAQEVFADAEAAGKAEAENETAEDEAAGSKAAKQPQPESQLGTAASGKASTAAAKDIRPAAVLEAQLPTVETAAPAAEEAAMLRPATEVPTATAGTEAATAQLDTLKQTQLAPTGAAAMDVDSEQPSQTLSEGLNKQATTAPAADKKSHAEAGKAAADAVPLVAALTDAGMGDAAAGGDAEMVQYDAQSDDEQAAPAKDKKQADVKVTKDDKAQRRDAPSTSKAVKSEASPHASARKRGREADEPARDDRKAPRTERRSDVRLSQREKDKEREREKEKDRDRAKDSKQANGDPPSGTGHHLAYMKFLPVRRTVSHVFSACLLHAS